MGLRFALRWTLVALACALVLLAAAIALRLARPAPFATPTRVYNIDDLLAAGEMRFDANGTATQIISGTILTLKLAPYPPRSAVSSTLTLVALRQGGRPAGDANPRLTVAPAGQADPQTYAMSPRGSGVYQAAGVFFPSPAAWRLRVNVYVGDDIPASMLATIQAN